MSLTGDLKRATRWLTRNNEASPSSTGSALAQIHQTADQAESLAARLTAARAALLDNLNESVSSRASASALATVDGVADAIKALLDSDNTESPSRADNASLGSMVHWNADTIEALRAALLDNNPETADADGSIGGQVAYVVANPKAGFALAAPIQDYIAAEASRAANVWIEVWSAADVTEDRLIWLAESQTQSLTQYSVILGVGAAGSETDVYKYPRFRHCILGKLFALHP